MKRDPRPIGPNEFDAIATRMQRTGRASVWIADTGSPKLAEDVLREAARVLGIDVDGFDILVDEDKVHLVCRGKA